MIIVKISVFTFGLIIGSFLNVVIRRLAAGESIVKKRSHCLDCGRILAWFDLIPLVSFAILRGRCRYCRKSINWQYPLVELATALLFLAVFNKFFVESLLAVGCLWYIIGSLVAIFVYDWRHYIIPDKILFPAAAAAVFWRGYESLAGGADLAAFGRFAPYFFSAIGAGGFFLIIILITRGRGMGLGDAKLAFLLGLMLGWPAILAALFLAFLSGALIGSALVLVGRKKMESPIPFGPFLIAAALAILLKF